jgi:hypothetical protein
MNNRRDIGAKDPQRRSTFASLLWQLKGDHPPWNDRSSFKDYPFANLHLFFVEKIEWIFLIPSSGVKILWSRRERRLRSL